MSKKSARTRSSQTPQRMRSYAWLTLNALVWGASFALVKPALDVTTPFRYLLYRYVFAVLLSLPFLWHYRTYLTRKTFTQKLPGIVGLELIGTTLALAILYIGLQYTTSIEANLLTTTLPIFITVGGVLLLKEREERHEMIGLVIACIGTLVLVFAPAGPMQKIVGVSLLGNALIIGSNVLNMFYFPLAKKLYAKLPKFLVTTISFYIGFWSFLALSWAEIGFDAGALMTAMMRDMQSISVWIAALYMAIFGSIIGLTAYIKGQDGIESSEAGLFYYLQPAIAIPLGVVLLGESVYVVQVLALLFVMTGVYWAERRR